MKSNAVKLFRKKMDAIRILETNFPFYSTNGEWLGKKTHFLLTYTPQERPFPEEEYQFGRDEIQELFSLAYEVLEIAENKCSSKPKKACAKTERHNARWMNGYDYEYEFAHCSNCKHMQWAGWDTHAEAKEKVVSFHEEYKYCPKCGARMTGGVYVDRKKKRGAK